MNKSELVEHLAKETGVTKKDAKTMIDAFVATVKGALKKGEKVALIGFGTFATRERKKRNGVNPKTGKKMVVPAKTVPYFKAGKALRESVK